MKKTFILIAAASWLFAANAYEHLWLYQGHWKGSRKAGAATAVPVDVENQCGRIGTYFGCQQTVDGKIGAVVLYVPGELPGHYHTQVILPDGQSLGRGEMTIEGDRWTFQSKSTENGQTTYYKTTNVFGGKNHIHFEQFESPDGEHWQQQASGDETRTSKGH